MVVTTGPNSLSKSDEYKYQPLSILTLKIISAVWPKEGFAGSKVQDHFAGVIFWAMQVNPQKPMKSKMINFSFILYIFRIAIYPFLKDSKLTKNSGTSRDIYSKMGNDRFSIPLKIRNFRLFKTKFNPHLLHGC
jgi:hypothetical protein